jgi:glycosyltransferase involved in cell wall biosynthesis
VIGEVPRITTILLSYKRPLLIDRAIRSVLKQSYKNLKVSIFDNASNDSTIDVIKKYCIKDSRVNVLFRENNIGFQKNLKHALTTVNTDYFSILCDDDLLSSLFYERAIDVLDKNLNLDFIVLDTLFFNDNLDFLNYVNCNNKLNIYNNEDKFLIFHDKKIPITITGIVFRKKVSLLYAMIHEEYDLGGDIRFTFLAAAKYNYAHLSSIGAFVYLHENEISANRNTFNPVERVIQMERYAEIFFDEEVSIKTKNIARSLLLKMLNTSYKRIYFNRFISSYISCYLLYTENNMKIINQYYDYLNEINKYNLVKIYKFFFYNKFIKTINFPFIYLLRIIKKKRQIKYLKSTRENRYRLDFYYNEIIEIQNLND